MKNKKILKVLASVLVTILLFTTLANAASTVLEDKYSSFKMLDRQNAREFYSLEKNSIDVLAIGSSQVMSGFCGPELYGEYGYTAFGLGTCKQPLLCSYYWLLEALKTQSPKVVLLETSSLGFAENDSSSYKALSEMKSTSAYKYQAVKEIVDDGDWEEFLGYYSSLYKFHSRWNATKKIDYVFLQGSEKKSYGGNNVNSTQFSEPLSRSDYGAQLIDNPKQVVRDETLEYFKKFVQVCKDNQIELVLFKTPKRSWSDDEFTAAHSIAEQFGLTYLDCNDNGLYDEIGFDPSNDMFDPDHLNYFGAKKMTHFLGEYLSSTFELTDYRDKENNSYEKIYNDYLHAANNAELYASDTLSQALEHLDDERYCIVISKTGNVKNDDAVTDGLKALGFTSDFYASKNAVMIKREGKIVADKASDSAIQLDGSLYAVNGLYYASAGTKRTVVKLYTEGMTSALESCVLVTVYDVSQSRLVYTACFDGELKLNKIATA